MMESLEPPPPQSAILQRAVSLLETSDFAAKTYEAHQARASSGVEQGFLKNFSRLILRTPPRITLTVALVSFASCVQLAIQEYGTDTQFFSIAAAVVTGCLLYTFFEYSIHRFGLHALPLLLGGRKLYRIAHGRHHIFFFPQASDRIVFPLSHVMIFLVPPMVGFRLVVGPKHGWTVVATSIFCHTCNELIHLYAHGHFGRVRIVEASRYYHLLHHLVSSKTAFGFCTPWWDFVLGTLPRPFTASGGASVLLQIIIALPLPIPFLHWVLIGALTSEPLLHPVMERAYTSGPVSSASAQQLLGCAARGIISFEGNNVSLANNAALKDVLANIIRVSTSAEVGEQISVNEVELIAGSEITKVVFEFTIDNIKDNTLARIKGGWMTSASSFDLSGVPSGLKVVGAAGQLVSVIGCVATNPNQSAAPSPSDKSGPPSPPCPSQLGRVTSPVFVEHHDENLTDHWY
jgi:4-hydroxysphinganine ceramide fatty acyl 2-hydroxylase